MTAMRGHAASSRRSRRQPASKRLVIICISHSRARACCISHRRLRYSGMCITQHHSASISRHRHPASTGGWRLAALAYRPLLISVPTATRFGDYQIISLITVRARAERTEPRIAVLAGDVPGSYPFRDVLLSTAYKRSLELFFKQQHSDTNKARQTAARWSLCARSRRLKLPVGPPLPSPPPRMSSLILRLDESRVSTAMSTLMISPPYHASSTLLHPPRPLTIKPTPSHLRPHPRPNSAPRPPPHPPPRPHEGRLTPDTVRAELASVLTASFLTCKSPLPLPLPLPFPFPCPTLPLPLCHCSRCVVTSPCQENERVRSAIWLAPHLASHRYLTHPPPPLNLLWAYRPIFPPELLASSGERASAGA